MPITPDHQFKHYEQMTSGEFTQYFLEHPGDTKAINFFSYCVADDFRVRVLRKMAKDLSTPTNETTTIATGVAPKKLTMKDVFDEVCRMPWEGKLSQEDQRRFNQIRRHIIESERSGRIFLP